MLLDTKHTLPALILLYSGIDAFASLIRPENEPDTNGAYFKKWAEDYMVGPSRLEAGSEDLWGVRTNAWLHSSEVHDPWPDFLVAFASNGCGDYFAYDTRQWPVTIIYIDPDRTVRENLSDTDEDKLRYDSFESWYGSYVS